ncbi:MAG: ADP-ribosylglycohydrolase family protein [Clostridia bacterium]|nr:ADP-ribosylglycohydrolase family protein [Clostridia bacterium]
MDGDFKRYLALFIPPNELICRTEAELPSWGYALNTWNIALWALLKTDNYKDCVLKAVNVGGDTDTNAAVAGAMAGVIYGKESIPEEWISCLQNKSLIDEICENFNSHFFKRQIKEIDQFDGDFAFLRLKTSARIEIDGRAFLNAASAYYALSVSEEHRDKFINVDAHSARKLFKNLPHLETDDALIIKRLSTVLTALYEQNQVLQDKLISTGNLPITYDTTGGHDNTLGHCRCRECRGKDHKNLYGKALMQVRAQMSGVQTLIGV